MMIRLTTIKITDVTNATLPFSMESSTLPLYFGAMNIANMDIGIHHRAKRNHDWYTRSEEKSDIATAITNTAMSGKNVSAPKWTICMHCVYCLPPQTTLVPNKSTTTIAKDTRPLNMRTVLLEIIYVSTSLLSNYIVVTTSSHLGFALQKQPVRHS